MIIWLIFFLFLPTKPRLLNGQFPLLHISQILFEYCKYVYLNIHDSIIAKYYQRLNFSDISRNCLLGTRKKIAKFLMRTFTCLSTFSSMFNTHPFREWREKRENSGETGQLEARLSCPRCGIKMAAPIEIWQCKQGHVVCYACKMNSVKVVMISLDTRIKSTVTLSSPIKIKLPEVDFRSKKF